MKQVEATSAISAPAPAICASSTTPALACAPGWPAGGESQHQASIRGRTQAEGDAPPRSALGEPRWEQQPTTWPGCVRRGQSQRVAFNPQRPGAVHGAPPAGQAAGNGALARSRGRACRASVPEESRTAPGPHPGRLGEQPSWWTAPRWGRKTRRGGQPRVAGPDRHQVRVQCSTRVAGAPQHAGGRRRHRGDAHGSHVERELRRRLASDAANVAAAPLARERLSRDTFVAAPATHFRVVQATPDRDQQRLGTL